VKIHTGQEVPSAIIDRLTIGGGVERH
jgi:hypothetical protein